MQPLVFCHVTKYFTMLRDYFDCRSILKLKKYIFPEWLTVSNGKGIYPANNPQRTKSTMERSDYPTFIWRDECIKMYIAKFQWMKDNVVDDLMDCYERRYTKVEYWKRYALVLGITPSLCCTAYRVRCMHWAISVMVHRCHGDRPHFCFAIAYFFVSLIPRCCWIFCFTP